MAVMSADTLDLVHDNDEVTHYEDVMYEKADVGVNVYTEDGMTHHPEVLRWEAGVDHSRRAEASAADDDGMAM